MRKRKKSSGPGPRERIKRRGQAERTIERIGETGLGRKEREGGERKREKGRRKR